MHKYLLVLLFAIAPMLVGQDSKQTEEKIPTPSHFHIQFAGGTINDLLLQIEQETKSDPNVICTTEAAQISIPPFKLHGVTTKDIFFALEFILAESAEIKVGVHHNITTIVCHKKHEKQPKKEAENVGGQLFFSVEFAGGTMGELLAQLEKEGKAGANVICSSEVAKVTLPAFKLYHVTIQDLTQALGFVSPLLHVNYKANVATIKCFESPKAPLKTDIYCIESYLKVYKVEDIVTAIQTAWEMQSREITGKLKFHADTKLLIALGTGEEQEIIKTTLNQLSVGMSEENKETKNR